MVAGLADDTSQPMARVRTWLSAFLRPAAQIADPSRPDIKMR
jgi:hypothetical protein